MVAATLALAVAATLSGCSIFGGRGSESFAGTGGHRLSDGKSYLLAGDTAGAEKVLLKATQKGKSAEAHYYLALLKKEADDGAALQHVQESLKLYPTAQAHLLKGRLLEDSDPAAAMESYRLGLSQGNERDPAVRLLHRNLGFALIRAEQWEEALDHMQACERLADSGGRRMDDVENAALGLCLYQTGDTERASKTWNLIRDPDLRQRVQDAAGSTDVKFTFLQ
jgi:tetratricopeptide (TPR) repeat protein